MRLEFRRIRVQISGFPYAFIYLCFNISLAGIRALARHRFAASIIVRFFSRLSAYKSRKSSRGRSRGGRRCARERGVPRHPGAVTPGNRMRYYAFATRERYVCCVAESASRSVACSRRFSLSSACSLSRADKARAMQPWEERNGPSEILPA